ncbi:glycosyltransferase BC10-like [Rhododendron vialii]|uniref:glycosyltransferase BC10-like n=1 Tax=Rhododendron vialii TaxID=182163 RepID=UPI00266012FF|nr:glycosyltransferase BC10-like [Rhododendron vialii]
MERCERGREEQDKSPGSITKDFSIGLLRLISVLIIFVVSVVVGFSLSSHIYQFFSLQTNQSYKNSTMAPMPATTSSKNFSVVLKYEEEDCLSMGSFISLKNLMDGMSDEELFWRASTMPKKVEYPCDRVPRVAFMFLTRGPLPMLPLWERFFKGHEKLFSIYVHARPGYELNVSNTSAFYGRQIPSQHVEWGSGSLVDAERRLLANALLDFSNERFMLLSESCIPIQNFPTVHQYLTGSSHSFVESYYNPARYRRWMWPTISPSDWRTGSQWFEMNRVLSATIVSDTKYYTVFRKHPKRSFHPEEHYIQTFLHMFHGSLNENRTVTWVDWSAAGLHPATFGKANITERFVQSIRNNGTLCSYNSAKTSVCYLFARKFEPSALEPLLNLSSSVMGF